MSTARSTQPGQQAAGGLTLNLASNNPFRNHTTSPVTGALGSKPNTPASPFDDPIPPRPVSRNPFLDPLSTKPPEPLRSPGVMSTQSDKGPEPTAEELFDTLIIDDNRALIDGEEKRPMNRLPGPHGAPRGGGPPRGRGRGGIDHRPTRSQEEAIRARRMQGGPPRPGGPSTSPQRRMERRPRRNSDSSLLDVEKPLTEEEKKSREARRREREKKSREGGKDKRPNRKVDIIDQLDATSMFGTGAFHHDGPFDACNPHRNRKGSRRAPMNAFAKDSLNNSIGGSGPLNKRPDHAAFMGNADEEAFKDYAKGGMGNKIKNGYNFPNQSRGELPVFDPLSRGAILHGDQSMGLGTSTFLEGTPAARTAIQKREAEQAQEVVDGGLQRKKSLAQRIRSINRGPHPSGRLTNPEGVYVSRRSPDPMPPATTIAAVGAGTTSNERNPFFAEFNNEPETITVRKNHSGEPQTPTSPVTRPRKVSVGLERRATTDAIGSSPEDAQGKTGRGLLGRVKSLKGGRKARNVSGDAPVPPAAAPGTAV